MPGSPPTNLGPAGLPGAPASGHTLNNKPSPKIAKPAAKVGPRPESSPKVPVSPLSTVTPGKVASLPDVTSLPSGNSLGALLGYLFGQMLGAHTGPTRDAAIGAASYMAAEQEAGKRVHDVAEPGWPTVLGAMPIVPQPIHRDPGQTL